MPEFNDADPDGATADEMTDADVAEMDRRFAGLVASGRLSEERLRAAFDKRFPPTPAAQEAWRARAPADELAGLLAKVLKERDEARARIGEMVLGRDQLLRDLAAVEDERNVLRGRGETASIRRMDSEEARAFWASVDRTVEEVAKWPAWMKRATISETGDCSAPPTASSPPDALSRMVPVMRRVRLVRLGTVQSASVFAWGRTRIQFAAHQDAGKRLGFGMLGAHGAWVRASETDDQALNG